MPYAGPVKVRPQEPWGGGQRGRPFPHEVQHAHSHPNRARRCFRARRIGRRRFRRLLIHELQHGRVVAVTARVQHRQRATFQQRIQAALAAIEKFGDLFMR